MDFEYILKNEYVVITRYNGTEENVVVPDLLDGYVTGKIGEFAFSECRNISMVKLPDTVLSIGQHAFYNCRNLNKLTLSDEVAEISDGAFKNCAKLKYIDIVKKTDSMKCLKGILSEINNEVLVTIHYNDGDAKLIFPYYLYDYEENTPARIINQVTKGSGIQYRECVTAQDIDYLAYDGIFESGMQIDIYNSAVDIAYNRVLYPYKLSEQHKKKYIDYIYDNRFEFVEMLCKKEQYDKLNGVLSLDVINNDDLKKCIENVRQSRNMDGLAFLLNYQKGKYGAEKKKFEF